MLGTYLGVSRDVRDRSGYIFDFIGFLLLLCLFMFPIRLCRKVGRGRGDRGRGDAGTRGRGDAGTWGRRHAINQSINFIYTVNGSASWFSDMPCKGPAKR